MRVLLVEPPLPAGQEYIKGFGLPEPLSLESLAGSLRHHDVRILDMRLGESLSEAMEQFRPQVVGAGCYVTGVYVTKRVLREVKRLDPACLTIVGGHHASLLPGDFLDDAIDVIAIGEGEVTLRELVDALERKSDLGSVAGLAMKRNGSGSLAFTPPRSLADLDTLPLPNRALVARNRPHYFRGAWRPIVSVSSERGCPFRCRFCSMWKVSDGRCRVRSARAVVEEIAALPETYVDFIDDNTLYDVKRAEELADLLKQTGVRKTYKIYARSDTIVNHPDLIEKWREVGMELALVGFESFRQQDMTSYGKRNSILNNERAIRVLQANGVEIAAYFVVNPDYTHADFAALSEYVDRWNLTQPVFTVLTPFPGTDLYADVQDQLNTKNYELFDFCHAVLPTALPLAEFQRQFYRLWKNAYSPRTMWKRLRQGKKLNLSLSQIRDFRRFMQGLKDATCHANWASPEEPGHSDNPPGPP